MILYGENLEPSRNIVISGEINEQLAYEIITQINQINEFDYERKRVKVDDQEYTAQPIQMFINSGGGSATDGFAIISAMEMSETPIITYGMGVVASMALAIFIAGDIRIASRFTRFMYHSVSYGMMGHITEHEEMMAEADILQEMYNSLMYERTKLSEDKLTEIRRMKHNHYFGAVKATKYGIADDVIDKPEVRIKLPTQESKKS
jgi:ATP-dependent Clp protease, protease subunit